MMYVRKCLTHTAVTNALGRVDDSVLIILNNHILNLILRVVQTYTFGGQRPAHVVTVVDVLFDPVLPDLLGVRVLGQREFVGGLAANVRPDVGQHVLRLVLVGVEVDAVETTEECQHEPGHSG